MLAMHRMHLYSARDRFFSLAADDRSCELRIWLPMVTLSISRFCSSTRVNGPPLWLSACMTATICPEVSRMGQHRMFRVVKPVILSMSGLNSSLLYASGMFRPSPVAATLPATPFP